MRLNGKVAVVTGATRGLGLGIAHALAREGAKVVINGRSGASIDEALKEFDRYDTQIAGVAADVSSGPDVERMFEEVVARFGTVDVLVNNAAYLYRSPQSTQARADFMTMMTTPAEKRSLGVTRRMSDEHWRLTMSVTLDGVFHCTREALKIMEPRRSGKIVNIASTSGISAMAAHNSAYSAAKGAVVAFTRAVALEVIGANINVNCVAPGAIASTGLEKTAGTSPELARQFYQFIPQGRFGKMDEYTSLVVYLASDDASYLVGQVISPNGGVVI